ncbi:MAG: glycoside hydrolase family 1 protein [bacterium]|nr:glycoside hydrolase family 1 protein [bacterium]
MHLEFPKGFLWGAATAAHQVEGNTHNDWTEWERMNAERLAKEAQKRHNGDASWRFPEAFNPQNYISGRACDHYNRFAEDFDIAKSLGHNAHRFSIEWSRVEPEEGVFDEKAIAHYREVLLALRQRGIEPFVTLWHFTNPSWFAKKGGWERKENIDAFLRYVARVVDRLDGVRYWIVINEPTVYTGAAYIGGLFPPQRKSLFTAFLVLKNLLTAHRRAYALLHRRREERIYVGTSHNLHYFVPYRRWWIPDHLAVAFVTYIADLYQLRIVRRHCDFIGLNYYFRDVIKFVLGGGAYGLADRVNPNQIVSDLGWDMYPRGIYQVLIRLRRYQKPIYITENGVADAYDEKRADFIHEHLQWVHKAIAEGADVRGYFHWSLLDNFEWDKGFWPRFGLVEMDYKTLERKIRPSARVYQRICAMNALPE